LNGDAALARHHWEETLAPLARDDLEDLILPEYFLARARLRQLGPT